MRHRTFLEYRGYRYLKLAVFLSVMAIVVYAWFSFPSGRYGGTWVGYGLGTINTSIIFLCIITSLIIYLSLRQKKSRDLPIDN